MMNANLNFLIRLGLSYGLHDREAFIEAFTKTFADHFSDPEKAGLTGEFLLHQMESLKEELEFARIAETLSKSSKTETKDLATSLDKLSDQIAGLHNTIEKLKL
ncbi:MAG: hypothetical protein A2X11_12630 [Bacteroidetes bacterium GWE2_42_24]|nr:MAG: hypothetical protein A2X11_12630 [Bacteroidetes bacterium GWE2_42_24]OFY30622.1 MAG: hypothetical protein A2X09_03880 [Bacteroidetes bacterium GWF2_43_11]PKP24041.1 MAG: hypothetical protein CVU06_05495 [Bacteroidetes bacterium HGW-Bacteroidetes-22]